VTGRKSYQRSSVNTGDGR